MKFSFNFSLNSDVEDITQAEVDQYGVSFIFKRALRRLDVQTEQRRLQQDKFDSHFTQLENDYKMLELKLRNKDRDFDKLKDKYVNIQVWLIGYKNEEKYIMKQFLYNLQKQMVELRTEKDIAEMKLEAELKNVHRLTRHLENMQWTRDEIIGMINRSDNIERLRQTLMSRKLF